VEVKNKRFVVIGLARSGIAAAKVLAKMGATVVGSDLRSAKEFENGQALQELQQMGVQIVLGEHPETLLLGADYLVVSPGVPVNAPILKLAVAQGINVISEVELAYRLTRVPFIAITGTNGKTTTTTLISEIFKGNNWEVILGGNIGDPLVDQVIARPDADVVVAEISSFQMEWVEEFRPKVSLILNITPDHIDRHGSFANYAAAKARIFARQGPEDFVVLNADDPETMRFAAQPRAKVILFSRKQQLTEGVFVKDGEMVANWQGKQINICSTAEIGIRGPHNLENAMAATAAALAMGVRLENLTRVLSEFQGVEHRLEFVAEINGVRYINDSKGTNCDAAIKALESFTEPIVLIAGGKEKGASFDDFAALAKEKAKEVILIGQAAAKIRASLLKAGYHEPRRADSMAEAVRIAAAVAAPGDVVLLSPACSSFDMFKCFEHRGEVFKEEVRKLRG